MNKSRTSYLKVLPLVFLLALLLTCLLLYREYHQPVIKEPYNIFEWLIGVIQISGIWLAVGLAFRQWKATVIALGVAIVIMVTSYFLYKSGLLKSSPVIAKYLYGLLLNSLFTPAVVFGLLCFRKQGLLYFLPFWLLGSAFSMLSVGCYYLETSPYNNWYFLFHLDRFLEVPSGAHSFHSINLFKYTVSLAEMTCTFIMFGEAYTAALDGKQLLRINLSTNYTKAGTMALFFSTRLLINIMVVGLFTFPLAYFIPAGRIYFDGMSPLSFILSMISGLALLVVAVLYYRKFLIEYFIAQQQKTQWLFWMVNIPIFGMLIFPFAVLAFNKKTSEEERTLFFYNDAIYNDRPWWIIVLIVVIGFLKLGISPRYEVDEIHWLMWAFELCLLIWYAAGISGYYAILSLGAITYIIYFTQVSEAREMLTTWYTAAFNIVNLVILLPVFHLDYFKAVQDPPEHVEYTEELSIPSIEH
jgi:hypothetical protein